MQYSYRAAGTLSNGLRASAMMQITSERSRHRQSCRHTSKLCSKGDRSSIECVPWIDASHSSKVARSAASRSAAFASYSPNLRVEGPSGETIEEYASGARSAGRAKRLTAA